MMRLIKATRNNDLRALFGEGYGGGATDPVKAPTCAKRTDVRTLVDKTVARFGRLDSRGESMLEPKARLARSTSQTAEMLCRGRSTRMFSVVILSIKHEVARHLQGQGHGKHIVNDLLDLRARGRGGGLGLCRQQCTPSNGDHQPSVALVRPSSRESV